MLTPGCLNSTSHKKFECHKHAPSEIPCFWSYFFLLVSLCQQLEKCNGLKRVGAPSFGGWVKEWPVLVQEAIWNHCSEQQRRKCCLCSNQSNLEFSVNYNGTKKSTLVHYSQFCFWFSTVYYDSFCISKALIK